MVYVCVWCRYPWFIFIPSLMFADDWTGKRSGSYIGTDCKYGIHWHVCGNNPTYNGWLHGDHTHIYIYNLPICLKTMTRWILRVMTRHSTALFNWSPMRMRVLKMLNGMFFLVSFLLPTYLFHSTSCSLFKPSNRLAMFTVVPTTV